MPARVVGLAHRLRSGQETRPYQYRRKCQIQVFLSSWMYNSTHVLRWQGDFVRFHAWRTEEKRAREAVPLRTTDGNTIASELICFVKWLWDVCIGLKGGCKGL